MKAKKVKKRDNRTVYFAIGTLIIIAIALLFLFSAGTSDEKIFERFVSSGTLKIESVIGDKLKIFNGENEMIKSSDISFFINDASIRCSGIRDLGPNKAIECTLEATCQKGDILKITYSGKSIEYNC